MHAIALPGFIRSRSPWPVWSGSARKPVRFAPMGKRQAVRLYHEARRFERQTRSYGRQDGALGRNGLAVLHALLFDFLNFQTGRLDPSVAAIAKAAAISVSSAKRGLVRLKAAGVVSWLRRCAEVFTGDGRFQLRQETNAYSVRPASQWRGFAAMTVPPPHPLVWGASPPLPDALDLACRAGGAYAMTSDAGDRSSGPVGASPGRARPRRHRPQSLELLEGQPERETYLTFIF